MADERKCACVSDERYQCFSVRYRIERSHNLDECCECACHDDYERDIGDDASDDWNDIAESEGRTRESWPAPLSSPDTRVVNNG